MIGSLLDWLRHLRHKRTLSPDLATGRRGEDLAHRYLKRRGYKIVARNYRLSSGEAEGDLIAHDGDDVVVVEVKTRATADYGPPERAIGPDKLRHITRVARDYARKSDTALARVRLDVVTVVLSQPPEIRLYRDAFRMNG